MRYAVLDQSPIRSGVAPGESIRETVALAQACERLGYHRYWLSEHHNTDSLAGAAPEVLLGALAVATSRIRIGAAGIMLPHYSALKVAEQFRVLEALAPGRVDLGLGRAPGSDGRTAFALNPNAAQAAEQFPAQVRDVQAWVAGEILPEGHPFRAVRAMPQGPGAPEIWILGSSNFGAELAAWFGLPYCFAYFFTDGAGAEQALECYRARFRPSAALAEPHAALVVWALAAATEAQAEQHYAARAMLRIMRERGQYIPVPSPAEVAAFEMTEMERAHAAAQKSRALVGVAGDVAARLRSLGEALGVQEIAITTAAHDVLAREKSYALLAQALGLHERELALAS